MKSACQLGERHNDFYKIELMKSACQLGERHND